MLRRHPTIAAPPRWLGLVVCLALPSACGSDSTVMALDPVGRDAGSVGSAGSADDANVTADGPPSCDDIPLLTPDEDGLPFGPIGLDQEVLSTLADYGAETPETYAGLWLDARYAGAPVVAFSDDPARHRSALLDRLATGGGMPFGLVGADHSLGDLEAAADALSASGPPVRSAAVDQSRNRVVVTLLDPTEAELDRLSEPEVAGLVCADIETSPPRPEGPLDVLPRDDRVDLVSCGEDSFPESALSDREPLARSDHPAAAAVARFIGGDRSAAAGDRSVAQSAPGEWIVLDLGTDRALFGQYDDGLEAVASVVDSGSGWEVEGWSFGCELQVGLPRGLAAVEVFLDPASPPRADRSTIAVLVSELACADGEAMGDRLLGPQVVEDDDRVLVAFAAVAVSIGDQGCPGNPRTSVAVELARPLGARTVMDGMRLPPRPLANP